MKKIRKEVDVMGKIQDCAAVVGLRGVHEDDAQVYVVMELCSGGDLERILEVSFVTLSKSHASRQQSSMLPGSFMLFADHYFALSSVL